MKDKRLELRVTQDLLDAIDAARGDVSRTRWVERALEKALGSGSVMEDARVSGAGVTAPPRVSERPAAPRPAREVLPPFPAVRQGKGVFTPRPKGKS